MGHAERNATIAIIIELLLKNKKKPRLVWNIFFGAILAFFLIFYIDSTVYILGGLSLYEENTTLHYGHLYGYDIIVMWE